MKKAFIVPLLYLSLVLTFSMSKDVKAQGIMDLDERKLAAFIYNFHNNISQPSGKICLYGYDGVISLLREYMGSKALDIKNTSNSKLVTKCNLAYIGRNKEKFMANFIKDFNGHGVSTIGYLDGFLEKNGTFYLQEGRRGSIELTLNRKMVKDLTIKLNPLIFNVINN